MNLTNFSIKRPIFTLVTMALFLLLGVVSLTNIPLKLIPDIDAPIAAVVTSYDNASPQEVVDGVSRPMENSLSTISGLNNISTISMEGSSLTILEFSWTTSIDDVENDIITAMNQTPLAQGAGTPQFLKFDPSQFPIIQLSLSTLDDTNLDNLVQQMEQQLLRIDGVASIDLLGDAVDEIEVSLNQELLEENGLDQADIVQAIQANNVTAPGGVVSDENNREISTRVLFDMVSVEDIQTIVLASDPETGETTTIDDVADVAIGPEPSDVITRTNQDDAILLSVQQQADANTAQVSRDFIAELDELLEESTYSSIDSAVLFNQGEFIDSAIQNVSLALVGGGLIAMAVLFLFLRSFKTPLLIGIAIPFSVIVTFVLLFFTNFSLNIMTLGGLALGIGMLVDNSIVVIENIYRHLAMKKSPKEAAADGAKEVAGAITASTLTTVSVFLPVVFISGIVGNLFREFALTVAFSLLASLLVALTVVPMIASRWLKRPKENEEAKRRDSSFIRFFDRSTRWSLKNRIVIFLTTLGLLIAGGVGITTVGTEFLPASDESFFTINVENETGTPLDDTFTDVQEIEEILDGRAEIDNYTSVTGSSGQDGPMGQNSVGNEAVIYVTLVPVSERNASTADFAETIRRDAERAAPDADVSISIDASFGGEPNTYSFDLSDPNPVRLQETADELLAEFDSMNEFTEVSNSFEETIPELQILVDSEAARDVGLTPAQIADSVDTKTRGALATQVVTEENDIYEVNVRYQDEFIDTSTALEELLIRAGDGTFIPLSDVATLEEGTSPETINRINQEESIQFSLTYRSDFNLGEIDTLVTDAIDRVDVPDEATVSLTGDQQLLNDAIGDLTLALILAVVFVYFVLAAQFESLKYPFVIMFTVPLVIIGVTIGLTVTQTPISVTAFIGFIVLVGIVVNNAIVLVDYINKRKESGLKSYDAIIEGVKDRARPIFMTASTTILALVPLALGIGEGSEIQQPLAITVIGGMISATFLTLFLIPVVYSFFDRDTRNLNKKYVTPDGQIVPAYLLEERTSKEQEEKRHFIETATSTEEYYKDSSEVPDESFEESMPKDVEDIPYEGSIYDDQEQKEYDQTGKKHSDTASNMSKEELLGLLEEIVKRNSKK
ncbi:efflux RND transporter permease subunit [Paenalkalicoccus suaedae]|uniref:Efflux RND transporter permease subunit n=1 Tax=Paenalkalicoccus suaedae TaxID=2592382 RepID=A0A859FI01_9BACI|nr:efflux RND transporter permease subunit [Paenalkalicoccus suaedae]QKS71816.1 efflux RND transporter permease subunit [Paenalkalicoccus suaedae]